MDGGADLLLSSCRLCEASPMTFFKFFVKHLQTLKFKWGLFTELWWQESYIRITGQILPTEEGKTELNIIFKWGVHMIFLDEQFWN